MSVRVSVSEQEPNGWELLRAIKGIENRFDHFVGQYVPVAVFATLVERVKGAEEAADTERRERIAAVAELRKEADEQRKAKAQQWFSIGLLAVGGVVTIVVAVLTRGLGIA
jgi:hypothetical protein